MANAAELLRSELPMPVISHEKQSAVRFPGQSAPPHSSRKPAARPA